MPLYRSPARISKLMVYYVPGKYNANGKRLIICILIIIFVEYMIKKRLAVIIGITLIFTACTPDLHVYNSTNASCLEEKKDGNMNLFAGLDHIEAQAAFSPVKHLGIFANTYFGKAYVYEGAVGYYRPIWENQLYFDIYAGGV